MRVLISFILLFVFSSNSLSQDTNQDDLRHWAFTFSVGSTSLDTDKATQEGIDDSAIALLFGFDYRNKRTLFGGGVRFFSYDDNQSFRQDTTQGEMSSTASGFSLFGEAGYRFPLHEKASFDLVAGLEFMLESERSIDNCTNCFSDEIDIESGPYISPRLAISLTERWSLGITYEQYLSGDINNNFSGAITFTF